MGNDIDINLENVRLSAELVRIYNRLLQVIIETDKPYTSDIRLELIDIADGIRETIGELNLYRRAEGEPSDGKDKD